MNLQCLTRDLAVLRTSSFPQLQFELALVRICEQAKLVPINKLIEKLESLPNLTFRQVSSEPLVAEVEEKKEPQVSDEKTWQEFLEKLKRERPLLFGLAKSLPDPSFDASHIRLRVKTTLKNSPHFEELIEKIKDFFKKTVNIEVEPVSQPKVEEIKERPEVKEVLSIFSAKIANIQILNQE